MKETWLIFLIMLAGGILFTVGFVFGISSMYYVIPLIIVLGIVYWYLEKTPEGKRNWSIATGVCTMLAIVAFIIVFVGSCVRGCSTGGNDTTQQRIEMGISPY